MHPPDDSAPDPSEELLAKAYAGNRQAQESAVQQLYSELLRIAESVLKRTHADAFLEATDLVQEATARVFSKKPPFATPFRPPLPPPHRTYHELFLGRMAHGMFSFAQDTWRNLAREQPFGPEDAQRFKDLEEHRPDAVLLTVEEAAAVDNALNALEVEFPAAARAVELRLYGGLSAREIAQLLQIDDAAVSNLLSQATQRLRSQIRAPLVTTNFDALLEGHHWDDSGVAARSELSLGRPGMERRPATPHVFLSYSNLDKNVAREITSQLRKSGANVWLADWEFKAGDSLAQRIESSLRAADYIIVLLSSNSVASPWVGQELNTALTRELGTRAVTVLPILLEDCEIPPDLADHTWIDLRHGRAAGLAQLIDRLTLIPDLDFSQLNGQRFEDLVLELLPALGFSDLHRHPNDERTEFDAVATLHPLDSMGREETQTWLIEAKFYNRERADLRSIFELARRAQSWPQPARVLIATDGQLTSAAKQWLTEAPVPLRVIEGTELKELLLREVRIARRYFSPRELS